VRDVLSRAITAEGSLKAEGDELVARARLEASSLPRAEQLEEAARQLWRFALDPTEMHPPTYRPRAPLLSPISLGKLRREGTRVLFECTLPRRGDFGPPVPGTG